MSYLFEKCEQHSATGHNLLRLDMFVHVKDVWYVSILTVDRMIRMKYEYKRYQYLSKEKRESQHLFLKGMFQNFAISYTFIFRCIEYVCHFSFNSFSKFKKICFKMRLKQLFFNVIIRCATLHYMFLLFTHFKMQDVTK